MTPEELNYTVYMHVNKTNNKKYIGCTRQKLNDRFGKNGTGYSHGQKKFYSAIQEFGWDNFDHIIIKDGLSQKEAWELEENLIIEYDTIDNGYNAAYGGEKNRLSEESKQKLREQRFGDKNPNYNPNKKYVRKRNKTIVKERIKKSYTFPEGETSTDGRKSIEARMAKTGKNNPNYGKHSWCYGLKYTEEQKTNMYKAWTEERKELIRQQKLGNKNPQAKKVLCVTTGITYDTIVEAARQNNLSERTVSDSCNGKTKYSRIKFVFREGDSI